MILRNVKNIEKELINVGNKTFKQVLISSKEGSNFAMRKFIIEPGGYMPLHTNSVEHEQYILNGQAKVQIGDQFLNVKKNDIIYIPKGVEHNYATIGDETFEFLCMIPNEDDTIILVEK